MAQDDEDDYLGDLSRFLQPQDLLPTASGSSPSSASSAPIRGRLSRQQRKKLKREEDQKAEDLHRSASLNVAISSSNKGFKMLQQMGYSPGAALGKHGQGSTEPIGLDVKRSRTGLGRDEMEMMQEKVKARLAELQRDHRRKKEEELKSGFQLRGKSSWQSKKLAQDYKKACNALYQLGGIDLRKREDKKPKEDEDMTPEEIRGHLRVKELKRGAEEEDFDDSEDSDEEITEEALQEVLEKLRTEHAYCLYCGCQYETVELLLANCPGPEDEH